MPPILEPADILLDQTTICEASRLLENPQITGLESEAEFLSFLKIERILHLSILLDGLALHEHVYLLKAEMPSDLETLSLRRTLMDLGLLRELDAVPYADAIANDLREIFSKRIKGIPGNEFAQLFISEVKNFLKQEPASSSRGVDVLRELISCHEELPNSSTADLLNTARPILAGYILESIRVTSSGKIRGISPLRTFVYWRLSELARIPLFPSLRRIPIIELLTDNLRGAIAEYGYARIGEIFGSTIKDVYDDESEIPLCLPPSLAIFLDVYKGVGSLPASITEFRRQFEPVRRTFGSLQMQLLSARSLGERRKIKRLIESYFKQLPQRYNADIGSSLQSVLSFAPDVVNMVTSINDPTKFARDLLGKPAEWIRQWWINRPLRHIYRILKRLEHITEYEDLLAKHLNIDVSPAEKQIFEEYYSNFINAYSKSKTPNRN